MKAPEAFRQRRRRGRTVVAAAVLTVLTVGGCSTSDGAQRATGQPPKAPAAGTPEPGVTTTAPRAGTTSPSPSTVPTTAVPAAPVDSVEAPFPADTRPDVSKAGGAAVLVAVTTGKHPGYDRYVFRFTDDYPGAEGSGGPARPGWDVRYVPRRDVSMDGSGRPVSVPGTAAIKIVFHVAAMHDENGHDSLTQPRPSTAALGFGGDFEGYVTWFIGVPAQRPFRAVYAGNGRVVVDVVT